MLDELDVVHDLTFRHVAREVLMVRVLVLFTLHGAFVESLV